METQRVIQRGGWRVRFYIGGSCFDRPRIYYWTVCGQSGVVLRAHRGNRDQPVVGVQWGRVHNETTPASANAR